MSSNPPGAGSPPPTGSSTVRHRSSKSLAGAQLADLLARNWWVLLLRGLLAVTFGVLAVLLTKSSLAVLVWPFGTYIFVDGVLGTGIVIGESTGRAHWWVLLFRGLTGVGVGLLTLLAPPRSLQAFFWYIAIWTIATGVLEIMTAYYLRRKLGGEWLFVIGGILSVVFAVLLFGLLVLGARALVMSRVIAAYALFFGVLFAILAFRARTAPVR